MGSILYSFLILFPTLVLNQKCPTFQSVIPLRPSATALNLSYAIVADGKYFLREFKEKNQKNSEPTGSMPEGFEDSRLITVVDRSDCNESQYYLIAIKSFRLSADSVLTSYSTLDLKNWELTTEWSEPKPLSEHPLFANDPYLKMIKQFDPNFEIEDFIHTLFYWQTTQTYFVVVRPLRRSTEEPIKSSSLRYYLVDAHKTCDNNYSHSERPESLSLALNTVAEPLDFCFFSHFTGLSDPLLYCVGGQSFQVNSIVTEYKNGSIRSESIGISKQMPTIDRLKVLGSLCSHEKTTLTDQFEEKDRIRVRIEQIRIGVVEGPEGEKGGKPDGDMRMNAPIRGLSMPSGKALESTSEKPEAEDSSSTFIIVLICLAIFVVIMIGILIIAARRQQQIAKM